MRGAEYERWLANVADEEIKSELLAIADKPEKIEDAFYKSLEFGTGGLRGVIGAGCNRMNIYTVTRATIGLIKYLGERNKENSVAIGYDTRIKSRLFAECAACAFASTGIKVYIYPAPYPTPMLSYAVIELSCSAGVMITASHNPKEYNGYKVYGSDGSQITDLAAKEILEKIEASDYFEWQTKKSFDEYLSSGAVEYISEDLNAKYLATVGATSKAYGDALDKSLRIVYTPLCGTGYVPVLNILKNNGYKNLQIVTEQAKPDGSFPTCPYPNPEIPDALSLALEYAQRTDAEIILATDPDCDRVGVAVKDKGGFKILTGNEVGLILLEYIASQRSAHGNMPKSPTAVKTVVTTDLAVRVAEKYGIKVKDVLTGFKYIGETLGKMEREGRAEDFVFGFEESCGYLSAPYVRDKDGVFAAYLVSEAAAFYKARGKTLIDVLDSIYREHGYERTALYSYTFPSAGGIDKMKGIMSQFRDTGADFSGIPIRFSKDYLLGIDDLPKSNVIKFYLDGDSTVTLRPSGTEPKLKVYISVRAAERYLADRKTEKIKSAAERIIKQI